LVKYQKNNKLSTTISSLRLTTFGYMLYLLAKTLHIIGFTAWFSGLFYLGRIFVYHREALENDNNSTDHTLMEKRAYGIICHPAMVITWICGLYMLYSNGMDWFLENGWMQAKLGLIILLTLYHLSLSKTIAALANGNIKTSSFRFRLLNEVPTLFLFAIIPLAVFKNGINALYAIGSLLLLMVFLYSATQFYKRFREKNT